MSKINKETKTSEFDFDLRRMKENVEGEGAQTAITLIGPKSPIEIFKALMDVNTNEIQDHCKL